MISRAVPRIVHLPTGTGGHPLGLSRAERELGFESDVIDFTPSYISYGADRTFDLDGRSVASRALIRSRFLATAIRKYDVFHFNGGAPTMALRTPWGVFNDLPLLKRLGKTVVVTWQGCDVRPKSACPHCERPTCVAQDRWREADARAMRKHADRRVFLNPDLRRYLPDADFLPYASVDPLALTPSAAPDREEVVVAHAPTNRGAKGTSHVVAAVERLRGEGLAVRLDLIEGVSNAEALMRIANSDVLVDQLHIGWYGGVAVEAMSLGRPVVAYIDEADNPFGSRLPIVRAEPATLYAALRSLIADRSQRAVLGVDGRAFAVKEHDPRSIVRRYYGGVIPFPDEG